MPDQPAILTTRQLAPLAAAAEVLSVDVKTVRRMISRGELHGYRIGGSRMIRVDLDEVGALAHPIPTAARGGAA